jgi:hypothetical protein
MLVERMPRGENNGKQRPAQPYFVRQIDPIHDATQPNVCEDQCNVLSTDQHDGKRSFGAFALNGVQLLVFKQRDGEAAQFSVILDD